MFKRPMLFTADGVKILSSTLARDAFAGVDKMVQDSIQGIMVYILS